MKSIQILFSCLIGLFFMFGFDAFASEHPLSCSELLFGDGSSEGCRDYTGNGWTHESAGADCGNIPGAAGGSFNENGYCDDRSETIGTCIIGRGTAEETILYFYSGGSDMLEMACKRFMAGEWEVTAINSCRHTVTDDITESESLSVCTEYSGTAWNTERIAEDCSRKDDGRLDTDTNCSRTGALGYCNTGDASSDARNVYYYSGDAEELEYNCRQLDGGIWTEIERQSENFITAENALESDNKVVVTPENCTKEQLDELIENKQAIEFLPANFSGSKGLIIYPGDAIDPRAYAFAARMIAAKGFLVALVPFPDGQVEAEPMRATDIIMSHPEITQWAIAGHSQGGASASAYAAVNPLQKIKAVGLWGAYPDKSVNLSRTGLKGLSVGATLDGIVDKGEWNAAQARLPKATYVVSLYGGNHSQFGYCGELEGDNPAKISRAYQHQLFTGATVHLLNRMDVPDYLDVITPLYTNTKPEIENWGKEAQKTIAALRFNDLRSWDIDNEIIVEQEDFQESKPYFPEDGSAFVNIKTYPHQIANPFDIRLPPVYDGELWVKMKSQAAFVDQYNVKPQNQIPGSCDQINQAIFNTTFRSLDWLTYFRFRRAGVSLSYGEDIKTATGPTWLNQSVVLENAGSGKNYTLKSSRLEVPTTAPAPYGGSFYCKVWSPAAVLQFILDQIGE